MAVYRIHHITRYEYDRPVTESINEIKIYPYNYPGQEALQHDIEITGNPKVEVFTDYFKNRTGIFNVLHPHTLLVIDSKLLVRVKDATSHAVNADSSFDDLKKDVKDNISLIELAEPDFIQSVSEIRQVIDSILLPGKTVAATVAQFCEYVFKNYEYKKGITRVETTVDELLAKKAGVSQDLAQLLLQLLRTSGIPSRYVSGYVYADENNLRGSGATHAWVEIWIPRYGWAGIDPSNNVWVTNKHIKLSVGRRYKDCSPVKGAFKGPAEQELSVSVTVFEEAGHVPGESDNENNNAGGADSSTDGFTKTGNRQQQQ